MSLGALLLLVAAGGPALVTADAGQGTMVQAQAQASVAILQAERISFATMDGASGQDGANGVAFQRRTEGTRVIFEFD